uniref:At1g61320/AtMIF1 LRR domain-containing protein n=1 Tax=Aegilops tauschii TaxID=37682 RepID=R7WF82_AEGTA
MRDAARTACVPQSFLHFWRCFPKLVFNPETLAAGRQPFVRGGDRGKYVFSKEQEVLENHSGIGVKTLKLHLSACCKKDIDTSLLDGCLQAFVKPGIVDLAVLLPDCYASEYSFPSSLLLNDDVANSRSTSVLKSLYLSSCGFHTHRRPKGACLLLELIETAIVQDRPQFLSLFTSAHVASTPTDGPRVLACSWSLSRLRLCKVGVTGDELWFFLSSCFSLEWLDLSNCDMITSLKIPHVLRKLKTVWVRMCRELVVIESHALKLSTFSYEGRQLSRFTLGDSLEMEELDMHAAHMQDMLQYAGNNLPSVATNLETLVLSTVHEKLKAPATTDTFKHLKHLVICLGECGEFCTGYDFLCLASFLDVCVALETFILRGGLVNLRKATITGFCSAKSLVELTYHILEQAASSLQCLILDTSPVYDRKSSTSDRFLPTCMEALRDAEKALADVRRYVEPKVPDGVELKVLAPCSRCHYMDAKAMEEAEPKTGQRFLQRQEDGSIALVFVQPRSKYAELNTTYV